MQTELEFVERLARDAGAEVMRHYGRVGSTAAASASPVTAADLASHALICARLEDAFPADAILSEEARRAPILRDRQRLWVVDPLDGTREFLARNGEFAVMIGLARGGEPVLGAVYLPALDVLYSAASGEGAWVERGGRRMRLAAPTVNGRELRLVASRSHADPLTAAIQRALGLTQLRPCGSVGVKCGLIAEGESDLYVHPVSYLKEWDTCAPEIVLRESGGTVTDCLGEPLRYGKPRPIQPGGILACAPGVHARVAEIVRNEFVARSAGGGSQPPQLTG